MWPPAAQLRLYRGHHRGLGIGVGLLAGPALATETVVVQGVRPPASDEACLSIAKAKVGEWSQLKVRRDRLDSFADGRTRASEFVFTSDRVYVQSRGEKSMRVQQWLTALQSHRAGWRYSRAKTMSRSSRRLRKPVTRPFASRWKIFRERGWPGVNSTSTISALISTAAPPLVAP